MSPPKIYFGWYHVTGLWPVVASEMMLPDIKLANRLLASPYTQVVLPTVIECRMEQHMVIGSMYTGNTHTHTNILTRSRHIEATKPPIGKNTNTLKL
jgi:hypothetical protein